MKVIDSTIVQRALATKSSCDLFWSRCPGEFVVLTTGEKLEYNGKAPNFSGSVMEWYETLSETIHNVICELVDIKKQYNVAIIVPVEIATILECSYSFRAHLDTIQTYATSSHCQLGVYQGNSLCRNNLVPKNQVLVVAIGCDLCEAIKVGTVTVLDLNILGDGE